MPIHPDRKGQIEVAKRATRELDIDEPTIGVEPLAQPRLDLDDLTSEEACGVHEMAAMSQHIVALDVRLGVSRSALGGVAPDHQRLNSVCHLVAVGVVAVPSLEGEQLPHFPIDERLGALYPPIKSLHVPDLKQASRCLDQ